jgi:AraC-like DNA-binding protein
MIACSCDFLRARCSGVDETTVLLNAMVAEVVADRSITRVAQLVERFGTRERKLQRLFGEYVGVSPKWVIQRARLIEAAERLAAGDSVDSAALAQDLGYFDQAHFIRDFGSIVGRPPADYARGVRRSNASN